MPALAETAPLRLIDTPAGQRARASVLGRATRAKVTRGSYRCTCCGKRCEVEVEYDTAGQVITSKGQCRTAGCIAWEG